MSIDLLLESYVKEECGANNLNNYKKNNDCYIINYTTGDCFGSDSVTVDFEDLLVFIWSKIK